MHAFQDLFHLSRSPGIAQPDPVPRLPRPQRSPRALNGQAFRLFAPPPPPPQPNPPLRRLHLAGNLKSKLARAFRLSLPSRRQPQLPMRPLPHNAGQLALLSGPAVQSQVPQRLSSLKIWFRPPSARRQPQNPPL